MQRSHQCMGNMLAKNVLNVLLPKSIRKKDRVMSQKKKFERFDKKLRMESLLKSVLAGVAVGAAVAFVLATVYWFMDKDGLLIALGAFGGCALLVAVLAHCTVFHPTTLRNAKRLDRYGLDERLVTMVELENDDSYIAKLQREDALLHLQKLDKKRVKLKVPLAILVCVAVFTVLCVSMTTVEGLSQAGVVPSGRDLFYQMFPVEPPDRFTVVYAAGTGGTVMGDCDQRVVQGESSERVLAIADEGYMFYGWDDGSGNPSRVDDNVTSHKKLTALFVVVMDDGEGSDDEDEPDDVPNEDGMPMPQQQSPEGSGNPPFIEINQVINNETYFRDFLETYYGEDGLTKMLESYDVPAEVKAMIEAYFDIVQ